MGNLKRVGLVCLLLFLVVVLALGVYLAPILRAGSGYAAKNLCSGHFISGFSGQVILDQALIGASPLLGNTSYEIDEVEKTVRTRLFGLFPREAVFGEATGCTLLPSGEQELGVQVSALQPPTVDAAAEWPLGSKVSETQPELERIVARAFVEEDPEAPRNTKAVVVVHDGRVVVEQYAAGVDAQTPLLGWSMTKSVINLLFGILVKDGRISLQDPVAVPEWAVTEGDPRATLNLGDLLQMSSGLEFDENYGPGSDVTRMLSDEGDVARFAASKDFVASGPRSEWSYSSGTTNILAGVLRRKVGGTPQSVYEFAQKRLFHPLGIRTAIMEQDASGTPIGSSYMYASARDWARLGQLCLQEGLWFGERLLPAEWIEYSTQPAPLSPGENYGAHFWLNAPNQSDGSGRPWPLLPKDTFAMSGYQGQYVFVVPSARLVVARFGFTPLRNHGLEQIIHDLLDRLPPAIEDNSDEAVAP